MIGLAANAIDADIAQEFFELFKTPWEWAIPGRKYSVVLSTDGDIEHLEAGVFLVYGSGVSTSDHRAGMPVEQVTGPADVAWGSSRLPIYGRLARFDAGMGAGILDSKGKAVDYRGRSGSRVIWRIGYDLFAEVRHLLTEGQPDSHALTPSLELHIALLRHALVQSGVAFLEIPPRPYDYDFMCCLTHDVDFFGIRRQGFDRTLAGFIARASVGSLVDLLRGRRLPAEAARNCWAVLSLPLVFLGLKRDFWQPFIDYAPADNGRRSTFFLVPFKNRPGASPDGHVDAARAVRYQISEIREELNQATSGGAELAVHGIDAWRDADAGRAEMKELTSLTGRTTAGVRMHWLYFGASSPRQLETAGFEYDATWGYNDTVGYRAGTSQVFRLPGSERLMELPLSIMDSALFSRGRMGLAPQQASGLCDEIIANARRFGGTLVVNWHCRSLAPERLWGRFYRTLLESVSRSNRVWFAGAGEAVDWFRWRRSIRFSPMTSGVEGDVTVSACPSSQPAVIRIHRPRARIDVEECAFDGTTAIAVDFQNGQFRRDPESQPVLSHQ